MQPIFEPSKGCSAVHRHQLPKWVQPLKKDPTSKKRKREADDTIKLGEEDRSTLRMFFEFGPRGFPTSEALWRQLPGNHPKPQSWAEKDNLQYSSSQPFYDCVIPQWSILMRQAMSLLCDLVRNDTTGVLTGVSGSRAELDAILTRGSAPEGGEHPVLSKSLLSLYCVINALDKNFNELLKLDDRTRLGLGEVAEQLCRSAEVLCDGLEDFVLDLLLSVDAAQFAGVKPLLGKLENIFADAAWPSHLLGDTTTARNSPTTLPPLIRDPTLVSQLEHGLTALFIRVTDALEEADATGLLPHQRRRLPASTSSSSVEAEYTAVVSRLRSSEFAGYGIRRAYLLLRLLFREYGAQFPTNREWRVLEDKLEVIFVQCVQESGLEHLVQGPLCFKPSGTLLQGSIERLTVAGVHRETVPRQSIAVLRTLCGFDVEGWFALPAFDMANTDFLTITLWVLGPLFRLKTGKEAFESLASILEDMANRCIATYGPSHRFSQKITEIRSKLVIACRAEKLL